ncbi:protein smoothened-like [Cotesia glomerata]|uniref:protein smoothened-like n=1 Tax=Cotesia glomerata TaxID=32391 RepID=UPI001D00CA03|nr:protein smoothened-like [Cotesia glomerata]
MDFHYSKVVWLVLIVVINKVTTDDVGEILKTKDCIRPVECVRMKTPDCLTVTLPYSMSSNGIVKRYYKTEDEIQAKLHELQTSLQYIPRCWKVVQPLLCMIFRPQCLNNHVVLPSQETCRRIEEPCRLVFDELIWPKFINCSNRDLFPQLNNQPHLPVDFDSSSSCLAPLVRTNDTRVTVEGLEGCGFPCKNALFSESEHQETHQLILWSAITCSCFNLAAILTFLINWTDGSHSDRAIFYINCCFLASCIGWLLQFTGIREAIVCRPDNTPRIAEPAGDSSACIAVFILIYFSLLAAIIWFGILVLIWFMKFDETAQKKYDVKSLLFHFTAWGIPAFSTIMIVESLNIIDANSMTGICFIGYQDFHLVHHFVFIPLFMVVFAVAVYIIADSKWILKTPTEEKKSKRMPISKILYLSLPVLLTIIVAFICHIWEGINSLEYIEDFKSYIICTVLNRMSELIRSNLKMEAECKLKSSPDVVKLHLQILTHFFAGIFMSLFVCEKHSLYLWISFFRRIFRKKLNKESPDNGMEGQEMLPLRNRFNS